MKWIYKDNTDEGPRLDLMSKSGKEAATVFLTWNSIGHTWFVWDENGTGGENGVDSPILNAMDQAVEAAKRWGKHEL